MKYLFCACIWYCAFSLYLAVNLKPIELLDLLKGGLTLKLFQKRNLLFVIKIEGAGREGERERERE